jgi:hypothetical protein
LHAHKQGEEGEGDEREEGAEGQGEEGEEGEESDGADAGHTLSHTHTHPLFSLSLQRPPLSLGMCVGREVIKKLQGFRFRGFRFRGSVSGSCSPHCDLTSFSSKP